MRTIIVLAKQPVAGRVKTRMSPPLTPAEAADLATAALRDTFAAVIECRADRRVCVFDGDPNGVVPDGFEVIPQRTGSLDVRLADAFADVLGDQGGPAVLIAMDTPQVTAALLNMACSELETHDAVLGCTDDGGYWIIGLSRADRAVFEGVPMSTEVTGQAQLERLRTRGLSVAVLPTLRDIDTANDVEAVTRLYPHLHTSKVWASTGFSGE